MKTVKKHWLGAIAPLFFCFGAYCQNGIVTTTSPGSYANFNPEGVKVVGTVKFKSACLGDFGPSSNGFYDLEDMYYINTVDLFNFSKKIEKGEINTYIDSRTTSTNSSVIVKVYPYESNIVTNSNYSSSPIIYQLEKRGSELGILNNKGVPINIELKGVDEIRGKSINSDNIKALLQSTLGTNKFENPISSINLFKSTAYQLSQLGSGPLNTSAYKDIIENTNGRKAVIVEIEVTNASVSSIKIPGLNKVIDLRTFDPNGKLYVKVAINGVTQEKVFNSLVVAPATEALKLKMGDKMEYKLTTIGSGFGSDSPEIKGMPGTWLANFAAESMYYCSPSVTPGEFSPWIGFDSNVHGSALFRYPTNENFDFQIFKKNVPPWTQEQQFNNSKNWYWSWTAQREMDPFKDSYAPVYNYPRTKKIPMKNGVQQFITLPDGTKTIRQMNNQREGLGMELLRTWKNYSKYSGLFNLYDGEKYLTGLDTDEVIYLDSNDPNKFGRGVIKQLSDPWKFRIVGQDSLAVNNMVTAYRRNREANRGNSTYDYSQIYDGYEIQDLGTDATHPNGKGIGNAKAPGKVIIKKDGYKVVIPMQVDSPLLNNKGFYSSITGTQWPTIGEENVVYTLTGLNNLTTVELNKFSLVLRSQNTSGSVRNVVKKLKDLEDSSKSKIQSSGNWPQSFSFKNLGGTGYYTLTAFYQREEGAEPVMIAGKELLETKLRITSAGNSTVESGEVVLGEGRGDGAYIYDDEYRDVMAPDYDFPKFSKFIKKYNHTYTFKIGSKVKFSSMDSDPHTFFHEGTDFYLSERFLAKRIPLDSLKQGKYLAYFIDKMDDNGNTILSAIPVGYGPDYTHIFTTKGQYQLRVVYRNSGELTDENYVFHKINIIDYPNGNQAKVVYRSLTDKEINYLNLSPVDQNNLIIAEIKDVYSTFMYREGLRAGSYANRFEKYNNYSNRYEWKNENYRVFNNVDKVNTWLENYTSAAWFPKNWVRHIDPGPVDDFIPRASVTTIKQNENYLANTVFQNQPESWQVRLPWIHPTLYSGTRIRTNIKVIYDLNNFFDNNTGAFSGNPTLPDQRLISFHLRLDDQLEKEDLYWDLKTHRKIILNKTILTSRPTDFYIVNLNGEQNVSKLVYTGTFSQLNQTVINNPAAKHASIAQTAAPKLEGLVVYPNPNEGQFNISWENPNEGEVSITLFSLNGAELFSKKEHVASGNNTGVFDTGSALPTGVYVLKIIGNGFERKTKVSVKSD